MRRVAGETRIDNREVRGLVPCAGGMWGLKKEELGEQRGRRLRQSVMCGKSRQERYPSTAPSWSRSGLAPAHPTGSPAVGRRQKARPAPRATRIASLFPSSEGVSQNNTMKNGAEMKPTDMHALIYPHPTLVQVLREPGVIEYSSLLPWGRDETQPIATS